MQASLHIHSLEIPVKIGVSQEERQNPQPIQFDIFVSFKACPNAVETDALEDTVCYDKLSQDLERLVQSQEYKLVEHLTGKVFQLLEKRLPPANHLRVTITKVHPPLQQKNNGVSFTLERIAQK